jgi:hypothetical protein
LWQGSPRLAIGSMNDDLEAARADFIVAVARCRKAHQSEPQTNIQCKDI